MEACDPAGEGSDGYPESQLRKKRLQLHSVFAAAVAAQLLDAVTSPWLLDCCSDLRKTTSPSRGCRWRSFAQKGTIECSRYLMRRFTLSVFLSPTARFHRKLGGGAELQTPSDCEVTPPQWSRMGGALCGWCSPGRPGAARVHK